MSTSSALAVAGIGLLAIVATANPSRAQLPTYGLGRTPTVEEIKAWDVTIPSDGQGLPPGSGTAALGEPIYARRCASCHGERGQNPKYDRLVGGQGTLKTDAPVLTIGSFWPYATTLWSYIHRSQPVDEPGSLTPDQVYAADVARPNRDPFDALICAAARHLDLPLLTRDGDIGQSGLVRVIW